MSFFDLYRLNKNATLDRIIKNINAYINIAAFHIILLFAKIMIQRGRGGGAGE